MFERAEAQKLVDDFDDWFVVPQSRSREVVVEVVETAVVAADAARRARRVVVAARAARRGARGRARDVGGSQSERDARGETRRRRARTEENEIEGARRRFGDDEGSVDAIGGQKSAVTDERRDARERTERAAVHAVL